ncbi:hypothetical protein ACPPVU_02700 [Mucilaginibacter sp. McL0603]|uniref:hypothetical protein n=1 Tax=Mucilaginibacter sp. McL0603 TaxID=3415670 RepID=UPI003CF9C803
MAKSTRLPFREVSSLSNLLGVPAGRGGRAIRSYGAGIRREGRYTLLSLTRSYLKILSLREVLSLQSNRAMATRDFLSDFLITSTPPLRLALHDSTSRQIGSYFNIS